MSKVTDKILRVEAAVGKTVNMGEYEFLRVDVRLFASVKPGEYSDDFVDELYEEAYAQVEAAIDKDAK